MAENCFDCHGPDREQRKAKLRLDVREGAIKDLGGYQSVMPGKPEQSELIARLVTDDEHDVMPPVKTGKALNTEEIDVLKQWIKEGANYPVHWAYRPIRPPALPKLKNEKQIINPIDRYVLAKLESLGHFPNTFYKVRCKLLLEKVECNHSNCHQENLHFHRAFCCRFVYILLRFC